MKAETDGQSSPEKLVEVITDQKKSRISYTRETLLSLSELDVCKNLPPGFDKAILSEFEEASNSVPERPRIPGSLSSQNFRRGEYGSSPPTRGDSANYSRERWDTHSSGSNDKDGDSQSDRDSDFGRRYGNQSRRSWQNSEHDGLLGSGASQKPPGFVPGTSASRGRGNSHYQLNKSNEPYHPPRPYKAGPHSRRDTFTTDMYNDETFGSSECSSEDRVEEERRRRASFELFRKEQQKGFQEKRKENVEPDIMASLVDSEDNKKLADGNNGLQEGPTSFEDDSTKCALPAQTPASRPLVPPGFTGSSLDKSLGIKPCAPEPALEVAIIGDDSVSHGEVDFVINGFPGNFMDEKSAVVVGTSGQHCEIKTLDTTVTNNSKSFASQQSKIKVSADLTSNSSPSFKNPFLQESFGVSTDGVSMGFDSQKILGNGNTDDTRHEYKSSILGKLLGVVPAATSSSSDFIECGDVRADDIGKNLPFQSSKFSHWFIEEENKEDAPFSDQPKDLQQPPPKDLLSLIVGSERSGLQASGRSEEELPTFPLKSNEPVHGFTSSTISADKGASDPSVFESVDATPRVLTCEDLEQSMFSGTSDNVSTLQFPIEDGDVSDGKVGVDSHASLHLLSLLKGPSSNLEVSSGNHQVYESEVVPGIFNNSSEDNARRVASDKSLTLETLFGPSFMKELHSREAPVSKQRGSNSGSPRAEISKPQGFTFPAANDGLFPQMGSEYGSNKTTLGGDSEEQNFTQQAKFNKLEKQWSGFDASHSGVRLDHRNSIVGIEGKADGPLGIRLPEEESLFSVVDPIIPHRSTPMPAGNVNNAGSLSSSGAHFNIIDKLASLNAALRDERPVGPNVEGPSFSSRPHPMEHNLQGWQSSPQFAQMQMNHWRPPFPPLEPHQSHMNPHLKLMGPENMFQAETHPQQSHFLANIAAPELFQNVSAAPPRFEPPGHHHPMLQQMHAGANLLPPPQLLQGMPRVASMPSQSVNHMGGFMPELSQMHGFHHGQRQRSLSSHEMPVPGFNVRDGGNVHSQSFEKLIEMQLGVNVKQANQLPGSAHNQQQPTFGHGIDLGFR
ncbi:hypothetical protein Scep_006163 [Stephania cephalantha]|uniref:Uncharacterized protein n=1 Tax=Stephania cephalantha TaxID=152367 RepID=A0AAP0K7H5_9MAGN